ncbi:MAG: hypothetical protein IJT70_05465 [Clostridia bacterium]|nr:hypothetical protein [Clostridia bacterium]
MTDKELKKLSRKELLDLLIYQAEENKRLKEELENSRLELLKREIAIEKSGTMAEAAMYISKVFENADRAAKIYLENIEMRHKETDEICRRKIEQAQSKVDEIISGAVNTIRSGSEAYFRSILNNPFPEVSPTPAEDQGDPSDKPA